MKTLFIIISLVVLYTFVVYMIKQVYYDIMESVLTDLLSESMYTKNNSLYLLVKRMNEIVNNKKILRIDNLIRMNEKISEVDKEKFHNDFIKFESTLTQNQKELIDKFDKKVKTIVFLNFITSYRILAIIGIIKTVLPLVKSYKSIKKAFDNEIILNPNTELCY